jgi:hypothetical protein
MRKIYIIYLLIIYCLLASCDDRLKPVDYKNWIEDPSNGLRIEKTAGAYVFCMQYRPVEYMAVIEKKKNSISENELDTLIRGFEGMKYYSIRISVINDSLKNHSFTDEAVIEYLNFDAQNDFKSVAGTDTTDCLLYHFENTYGLTQYNSVVLGFPESKSKDKTIVYNDSILGTGTIVFNISAESLNKIPQLKTY